MNGQANPGTCPICEAPAAQTHRPFCSARCKMLDLGRWLDGSYRLESEDEPDEAEIIELASRQSAGDQSAES